MAPHDFDYLFDTQFDSKLELSVYEFKQFWYWFGPLMQKIRSQYKIADLWRDGVIAGFLSRTVAEETLISQAVGTFLIRVSSEIHGVGFQGFVISFRDVDANGIPCVNHYLLKDMDISFKSKSVVDYIRERPKLTNILELHIHPVTQVRTLLRSRKHNALASYYNNKTELHTPEGYVEFI